MQISGISDADCTLSGFKKYDFPKQIAAMRTIHILMLCFAEVESFRMLTLQTYFHF